jgi:hypothetical protein
MRLDGFDLATALLIGGVLHFGILLAAALVPLKLNWGRELAGLSALTRQLIWTHGGFIVLTIIGFGTLTLATAGDLATGEPLARAVCGLIAVFWSVRIAVGLAVFELDPILTSPLLRFGERALMATFAYLAAVYGVAALA